MLEKLLETDEALFLFLNKLGNSNWDNFWLVVTHKFTFIPLYAILLFLIYKRYGLKALIFLVVIIAAMITFTDQITNLFKHGFMRPRPCKQVYLVDEGIRFIAKRCGRYGFFSGHSSNSMAAAVFGGLLLRPYFKNLLYLLVLWSIMVAYSRIYVGVHYPLDIIFGMLFGALSGIAFYKIAKIVIRKYASSEDDKVD